MNEFESTGQQQSKSHSANDSKTVDRRRSNLKMIAIGAESGVDKISVSTNGKDFTSVADDTHQVNDISVTVSEQQQKEVYTILEMLQHKSSTSKLDSANKNGNDEFDGDYNSGEEDGQAIQTEINEEDDDDNVEFSGGLNSGEVSECYRISSSLSNTALKRQNPGVPSSGLSKPSGSSRQYYFGKPRLVKSIGKFPELGSILGPFFCLGQLGKGTFSSIHKCINMKYFHKQQQLDSSYNSSSNMSRLPNLSNSEMRLAAAKVELISFQKSGVLESEATILDFLHSSLPSGTVPVYMGHYKSEHFAAIFMEYLPGEDMHQLREYVMAKTSDIYNSNIGKISSSNVSPPTRRMNVADAVYLTADVMLPLLRCMHDVGVVHRDVKPSNCVRAYSNGPKSKKFCMVDFGLSKSIIVPEDSEMADRQHYWDDTKPWLKPYVYQNMTEKPPRGCYLQERKKADFRGTSMYASLRVHQCRDYCPRDDVWSLLYVFCDLVTGGLPWMQHAANRDRDSCQRYKEQIHGELQGESLGVTAIPELLKGDIYHKAVYQQQKSLEAGVPKERLPPLPPPLTMSEDSKKVQFLSRAFEHVAQLQFWDIPDYRFIQDCIRGFLQESNSKDPFIPLIDWGLSEKSYTKDKSNHKKIRTNAGWRYADEDPLDEQDIDIFEEASKTTDSKRNVDDFLCRIPVELRFRLAQMDYNVSATSSNKKNKDDIVPVHRALNDWMDVTLDLLYEEWDSKQYEHGGHRTNTDGFKRDCYLQLLEKCRSYARHFQDFGSRGLINKQSLNTNSSNMSRIISANGSNLDVYHDSESNDKLDEPGHKRKKISIDKVSADALCTKQIDLVLVSKCIFGLEAAIKTEQTKKTAPPVRISFG